MVKRKAKGSDQSSVSSEQVVELRDPEPVSAAEEYVKGMWAGQPHYTCTLCLYDTLDESMMLRHIQMIHHPQPAPKRAPSVLVADKRDNEITLTPSPSPEGRGEDEDGMFEVELEEVECTTDEQGNEHKIYTIKE